MIVITSNIAETLNSHGTTFWLKRALMDSLNRDPVDAIRDAETLVALLREGADATPQLPGVRADVEQQQRAAARPLGPVFSEFTAPNLTCHDCRHQVPHDWTRVCPNCGASRERIWP